MDRRAFLLHSAGYALAVSPVTALAMSTSADGLTTSDMTIDIVGADKSKKESMPAYFARPKKAGKYPVVIVVQEIFGIHEYIKDVCRRLAKEGFVAIAPSLYFRQGDATKIENMDKLRSEIVSKVSIPQVMSDLDATYAWLSAQSFVKAKEISLTGFCWGGGITWLYADHNPKIKSGVAWYGRLTGEKSALQPLFPMDVAASHKVPVLGLYGAKDKGIPQEQVDKMKAALATNKAGSRIDVYQDAEHGFHADYRPSYHEKSAKDGWSKMLAWFKKPGH